MLMTPLERRIRRAMRKQNDGSIIFLKPETTEAFDTTMDVAESILGDKLHVESESHRLIISSKNVEDKTTNRTSS